MTNIEQAVPLIHPCRIQYKCGLCTSSKEHTMFMKGVGPVVSLVLVGKFKLLKIALVQIDTGSQSSAI